ncbi:MAG: Small GTP-binding domain protein [Promethearchaeota archaeon]|nr:MAG: Small GTP-binding domain protein [Candidatus Lokiarchaeota archaeon]
MLRQIYIYRKDKLLYYRKFGKAVSEKNLDSILEQLEKESLGKNPNKMNTYIYFRYRISYLTDTELNLIFIFITGLTDNPENVEKELIICKKEFLNIFGEIIQKNRYDELTFQVFDPTTDLIHKNLRPKISLVGFSGVGKTTITRLIKAEEIPMKHIPTITGDIATIKIGKLHFHLWDFAGQEQFSYLYESFIKGSDAVLLITDSSLENVEKSKFFLELINEQAPNAHTSVIANKQDLDDALPPEDIEGILGLKAYSMIAIDSDNRDKMIKIIADILEMDATISPLLQPLLERDEKMAKAQKALESEKFQVAANLFEEISDLCLDLGDDSLSREFYEKAQQIKSMLQKVRQRAAVKKTKKKTPDEKQAEEAEKATKEKEKEKQKAIKKGKIVKPIVKPVPLKGKKGEKTAEEIPRKPPMEVIEEVASEEVIDAELKQGSVKEPSPEAVSKEVSREPPKEKMEKPPKEIAKEPSKEEIGEEKAEETVKEAHEEVIEEEPIEEEDIGEEIRLELNPEDFMVKQRPKKISVVPKDARNKLKTSSYGHVVNPDKAKSTEKTIKEVQKAPKEVATPERSTKEEIPEITATPPEVPISEIDKTSSQSLKSSEKISETPQKVAPKSPSSEESKPDMKQKKTLESELMDLKIQKAKISKMLLDFELKELSGEISGDELNEKTAKLAKMEERLKQQIDELENLINN